MRAHIQAAVDGNLERLGVDHIDLLQVRHGCGLPTTCLVREPCASGSRELYDLIVSGAQIHWPDRYVPLFGASGYDVANEREEVPFEEQLRGMEAVIKAGKVCRAPRWLDSTVFDQYTKSIST